MSAAVAAVARRGACPGLSAPMPTGDGLLVRLAPVGTIPCAAFAALCAAADRHGNGTIEITSRGSIQVRGLSATSAPRFAKEIATLGIAAADGVPILCPPLTGLDPGEFLDAGALAADLRHALMQRSMAAELAAKISIIIDGGGALGLDAISADIRLRAEATDGEVLLGIAVDGDGASATSIGAVTSQHGVTAVTRLLDVVAKHGRTARARDILAEEGTAFFRSAIEDFLVSGWSAKERKASPAIGLHHLRDGTFACGIGLAFGHADAASLERLTDAARDAGASGLRAAPGRVLMAIGLTRRSSVDFVAAAERLGFITRADDPRRRVVACAGAPICASAHIAARAIAPRIAETAAFGLDDTAMIHISGCAKGCARAAPAALTVVGTPDGCALVANGSARDTAFAVVTTEELPAAVARHLRTATGESRHV
jgi:precorrin-3B synthase